VKTEIRDINSTSKCFIVHFSKEELLTHTQKALDGFLKYARIPGFRPGKAPADRVKQQYADKILEERNDNIRRAGYKEVINQTKESKLNVIAITKVSEDLTQIPLSGAATPVSFTVEFVEDFVVENYKGIPINKQESTVSQEELDEALKRLQKQRANYEVTTELSQPGDYVNVSYTGKIGETAIKDLLNKHPIYGTQTRTWEEAGAKESHLTRLMEAFIGKQAGDKGTVTQVFPEDFLVPELAGKTATYEWEIHEVRRVVLPELDTVLDEFAQQSKVESKEVVVQHIKQQILAAKQQQIYGKQIGQIIDYFNKHYTIEVPPTYLNQVIEELLTGFIGRLSKQGMSPKTIEANKDSIYKQAHEAAQKEVKPRLILEKIARLEKIELKEDDLRQALYHESVNSGKDTQALLQLYKNDSNKADQFRQNALRNKTLAFLLQHSSVSDEPIEAPVSALE
jgi:trigger factor